MTANRRRTFARHTQTLTCTTCRGEGVTIDWAGSEYDGSIGGYYPREEVVTCRDCHGSGEALCAECEAVACCEDPAVEHVFYCDACAPESVRALQRLLNEPTIDDIVAAATESGWLQ